MESKREKSYGELRTEAFKEHLQAIIKDRLGEKVSKETSWNLFKDVLFGTLQFTCNQEDKRVPLSGVGRFEVIRAVARSSKKEEGKKFTPKFRFYPSTSMDTLVQQLMGEKEIDEDFTGLGLYNTPEVLEKVSGQAVVNNEWLNKE